MVVQNNKKGRKLDVKMVFLSAILFASIQQSLGQKLDGEYRDGDKADIYSQLSLSGSRFEFRVENPYTKSYLGKGYYLTNGDTLVLVYETDPQPRKSGYSELNIESCDLDTNLRKSSVEFGQYFFKVLDERGTPIPNTQLSFFGRDGYLFSKATDRKGELELVTGRKSIVDVRVRSLGYDFLKIIPDFTHRSCLSYNITLHELPGEFHKSHITIERILIIKENDKVVGFQQQNSSRRWMRLDN